MALNSDALVRDANGGLERLREIMRRLRDKATGCPWDIEQTFASIAPYTLEEAHEVADVIADRLLQPDDAAGAQRCRDRVEALCERFPLYANQPALQPA